jgi:DivIVA domain-containing protein
MRKKKDGTTAGTGFEAGAVPTGPLTPIDIQQKKFGAARFGGGYRMREVDEFLDQVTDALSALIAENERLRAGGSASVASAAPPPAASVASPAAPPAASVADRAGVDAFLEREKGFLQSLGGLVQEHAEELKEMVRAARREWVAAAAAAPVVPLDEGDVEPPAAIAAPEVAAPEVTETDEETDAEAGVQEPREAESESDDAPPAADEPPATEDPPETGAGGPQAPIRLEEPEPARARRSEDGTEGSLRELFWGED